MFEFAIDPQKYQIFLMECPAIAPPLLVTHHWFVLNEKGKISRWEVNPDAPKLSGLHWGRISKDAFPPFRSINMLPAFMKPVWKSKLVAQHTGIEDSLAQRMALFVTQSPQNYPYKDVYNILGPNSNTYIQWILDKFPTSGMKLPWRAVGK